MMPACPSAAPLALPRAPAYAFSTLEPFGFSAPAMQEHFDMHHRRPAALLRQHLDTSHRIEAQISTGARAAVLDVSLRYSDPSVCEVILHSRPDTTPYRLAAMVHSHDLYWQCLAPAAPRRSSSDAAATDETTAAADGPVQQRMRILPETTSYSLFRTAPAVGRLLAQIEVDFGSIGRLMAAFELAAGQLFASGWVWLLWSRRQARLVVVATADAVSPLSLVEGPRGLPTLRTDIPSACGSSSPSPANPPPFVPLIACDLWEHAYLPFASPSGAATTEPKRENHATALSPEKRRYLRSFWSALAWEFVASNFDEAAGAAEVTVPVMGRGRSRL